MPLVNAQMQRALELVESQANIMRARLRGEYEHSQIIIETKSKYDFYHVEAMIEQSREEAILRLDQQFSSRKLDIEKDAQEQRLLIESTAKQLLSRVYEKFLFDEMKSEMNEIVTDPQRLGKGGLFLAENDIQGEIHQP